MSRPRLGLFVTTAPLLPLETLPESSGDAFERACATAARDGYAGLDISCLSILLIGKARFARVLSAHGLLFIGKAYSSGAGCPTGNALALAGAEEAHPPAQGRDAASHIAVFGAQVREMACAALRPLLVSVSGQSGRDYFSLADEDAYLDAADALAGALRVRIQHETHRHRLLFNPWCARAAVRRRPALALLADLSHYVVVCEAPCDDPDLEEAVAELLPRVRHTHARVGHEEGPQVHDPSNAHWARHVEGHVRWWKAIFRHAFARAAAPAAAGGGGGAEAAAAELVTVTPEHLNFPYGPFGSTPEDTAKANAHMAAVVRKAWAEVEAEFPAGS